MEYRFYIISLKVIVNPRTLYNKNKLFMYFWVVTISLGICKCVLYLQFVYCYWSVIFFSNNWFQNQKVYLAGKLKGMKSSSFKWEQSRKKESLGLRNLTVKTTSYGRRKWRDLYKKRICSYHLAENQNNWWQWRMKNGRLLTKKN